MKVVYCDAGPVHGAWVEKPPLVLRFSERVPRDRNPAGLVLGGKKILVAGKPPEACAHAVLAALGDAVAEGRQCGIGVAKSLSDVTPHVMPSENGGGRAWRLP